jgi:hypothetical protein
MTHRIDRVRNGSLFVFCVSIVMVDPSYSIALNNSDQRSVVMEVIMLFRQQTRLLDNIMTILLLVLWCKPAISLNLSLEKHEKRLHPSPIFVRTLQAGIPYNVQLFLSLDYLNDTIAAQFESTNVTPSNDATTHFCYAVNFQVRSVQVGCNTSVFR